MRHSVATLPRHTRFEPQQDKTGLVKWFDTTKGYGFIVPDEGGNDVFVHASAFEHSGFQLTRGVRVSFAIKETYKGIAVSRIISIEAAQDPQKGPELLKVDRFSQRKGYGFFSSSHGDILVHASVARKAHLPPLEKGQCLLVWYQVVNGHLRAMRVALPS